MPNSEVYDPTLPMKLQKGNVFSRVCLPVCLQKSYYTGTKPCLDMFKYVKLGPRSTEPPPLPDMFKFVYYEAGSVGERVVDIRLKSLLVSTICMVVSVARRIRMENKLTAS